MIKLHNFQSGLDAQRMRSAVIYSSALSIALLALRFLYADRLGYLFLAWNLFLAWVPYLFSLALQKRNISSRWAKASVFILWLLFFPNAPYLITDLIHLKKIPGIPLWYDVLLLVSFAWSGLLAGLASLGNVHAALIKVIGITKAWLSVGGLMVLCAFGIYLGRFLRWNSWDALVNPVPVIRTSVHLLHNKHAMAFTLIFSAFLLVTYLTLLSLSQANEKRQG